MIRWWLLFAIAVPASYLLGVDMANSDTNKVYELKTFSCQLMYKVLRDDLENKLDLHDVGIYTMTPKIRKRYMKLLKEFEKNCIPEDPVVDKIERNEIPKDVYP
jgi:hypothetical protein